MSVRDDLLQFLREPADFCRGAVDPAVWLEGLSNYAIPQLEAGDDHPLRDAQLAAWRGLADKRAGLVLGPPGTGKTHLLAWFIVGYIQARRAKGLDARVYVSAFTRNAIGHLLDSVARLASRYAPGLIDVVYIGAPPPAGLSSAVTLRKDLSTAGADAALATLLGSAVVMGGSIWSLTKLTARPLAGGDGFTAALFDLVCIDEASQMVVSHGLMAMAGLRSEGRVVVAGDDRQLPPIRASREISLGARQLGGSLYGFLSSGGAPEFALEETFRLNAPLSDFPRRTFYLEGYRSAEAVQDARLALVDDWRTGLLPWEADVLDPDWPVAIILHNGPPAATQNPFEAELVARLTARLADRLVGARTAAGLSSDFWVESLAIISPHRAQNVAIRNALPAHLAKDAFVETVDRIQGKERDAVVMSYCVADAEFAVAEADFIFAPERLNVAITRAKTKLILLVSRRLLEAVPGDQEAMDKAEKLREFVFGAAPRRNVQFDDTGQGVIEAEVRLRGFDVLPDFDVSPPPSVEEVVDESLTDAQSRLLDAVRYVALRSKSGMANIKDLQAALATRDDLLPDLSRLHALGWINLTESTLHGSYWRARPLDPRRKVFAADIVTVRERLESVISQVRSGRAAPFYDPRVRERFAWMNSAGVDVLRPFIEQLKDEGLVALGLANGSLTVDWVAEPALDDAESPPPSAPDLQDADFEVLNALETMEAARINFGVVEGWTSIAELADLNGLDRDATAGAIGRLAANGWLMVADEGRIRSRMAEQARAVRYVKQRFRYDDADSRPYLVRSLKVELLERDKPERIDRVSEAVAQASTNLDPIHRSTLAALEAMLGRRWGSGATVAGFQARSLTTLSQAWAGKGGDTYVVAADTGSGKTEAAVLPLLAAAAADRLKGVAGVRAIFAYPRIRLATNQAQRIAGYLADFALEPGMPTVTLGLQIGQVPRNFEKLNAREVESGWRTVGDKTFTFPFFACPACDHDLLLAHRHGVEGADKLTCTHCTWSFAGWVGSKVALQTNPPAFFLPTTDSLHQWMHNPEYGRLFGDDPEFAAPRALVADEIHLYSQIHGAQVGYAFRRLLARAEMNGGGSGQVIAVGMSATLGDPAAAWARLVGRASELLTPLPSEKRPNPRGREYFYFIQPEVESRGKDIAGASTTIQSLMSLAHGMRRRTGSQGGFRSLVFLDSIDKVRRLHSAYDDAEGYKKLAALRTRDYPDDPLTGTGQTKCCGQPHGCDVFAQGECWWFAANDLAQRTASGRRRPGAPLSVAEQPVFSGTSGRVEAMIKRSDIVFATSSLEVGYDDPDISLVYQHYAPSNLASFIQRKGRGGRGVDDRPITGVTLSPYSSRDSWWFRKPREMISPHGYETPLNPDNFFVRRGQLVCVVLDSFARSTRLGWSVDVQSPNEAVWAEAKAFAEKVLGAESWAQFGFDGLEAFWRAAMEHRKLEEANSLPELRERLGWAPKTLFENINVPRLVVKGDGGLEAQEDIGLALATTAPGNATRRFDGVKVYWRPPVSGAAPWFDPVDYTDGQYNGMAEEAEPWISHLPEEARPLLANLRDVYFRPKQITVTSLGKMHGAGWASDWIARAGPPASVERIGDDYDQARLVRHDSRGSLRGFPIVKADTALARPLPIEALSPWIARVEIYLGDGVGGKTTGLAIAKVYWGADVEAPLSGPPPGSETFTQVFTGPDDPRPLLHGYHVQSEGVRYVLNFDHLTAFVDGELERLKSSPQELAWRENQLFRYVVQAQSLAEGLNSFDAQRIAELLSTTIADKGLRKRLKAVLAFWDKDELAELLEDTRAGRLGNHPLLSQRRVERLGLVFGEERGRRVLQAGFDSLGNPSLSRRHMTTAVVHGLAVRLKDSFVQTARCDERQVLLHSRLPIQFAGLDEAVITISETGAFGDGTTRAFIDQFEMAGRHWRDGFIADCPNALDDAVVAKLWGTEAQHADWKALDQTSAEALAGLGAALGLAAGQAVPATVMKILFGREQIGLDQFALYDLARESRSVQLELESDLGRPCSSWELVSAVIEAAKRDPSRIGARALAAYSQVEDAAFDDGLSPENRLADQLVALQGRLCLDGCQACVHQPSDLMSEGLAQVSTSRMLLNRFICEPIP